MYRFTDTNKWDDDWFYSLSANAKLMFYYFCDNCDNAGFMELSIVKMRDALKPLNDEELAIAFNQLEKCYIRSRDKKIILLINFIKHQKNTPLNHRNLAHKGIFNRIEFYKDKFAHNIINIINKGEKVKQNTKQLKGLQIAIGVEVGNIPFEDFYNLYNRKIGDKNKTQSKWEALTPQLQKKIISILPAWKKHFDGQIIPYPETFLNQERWNDDLTGQIIPIKPTKEEQKAFTVTSNKIDHRAKA